MQPSRRCLPRRRGTRPPPQRGTLLSPKRSRSDRRLRPRQTRGPPRHLPRHHRPLRRHGASPPPRRPRGMRRRPRNPRHPRRLLGPRPRRRSLSLQPPRRPGMHRSRPHLPRLHPGRRHRRRKRRLPPGPAPPTTCWPRAPRPVPWWKLPKNLIQMPRQPCLGNLRLPQPPAPAWPRPWSRAWPPKTQARIASRPR
jgi:hypothetical protein